ncbi:MAG: hypothetical protein FWG83_00570 [Oscillospiraceae bacterium]|nr:hypothetical protein [Oscillospiraceae bacterium]
MTAKQQLLSILDFVGENEAMQILLYAKDTFSLKIKTWDDIEEDEPTTDEIEAFKAFREERVR